MVIDGISLKGSYHSQNQDSCMCSKLKEGFVIALSDGLGSLTDSKSGSQSICESIVKLAIALEDELMTISCEDFVTKAHQMWRKYLLLHNIRYCYATMLFVVKYRDRVFGARLGDGFLSVQLSDEIVLLKDDKEGLFANETYCLTEVLDLKEVSFIERSGVDVHGAILCSDGITINDMSDDILKQFTDEFLKGYSCMPQAEIASDINSWLSDWPGSDDKTIAYCIGLQELILATQQYEDISGFTHYITKQLGQAGGQGTVYRTQKDYLAVKIIHAKEGKKQQNFDELNSRFADLRLLPIPQGVNLTLPLSELKDAHGYVMSLLDDMQEFATAFSPTDEDSKLSNPWLNEMRSDGNNDFADFVAGYIATGGLRRRIAAYQKAARILAHIHSLGLVYCDFSGRNCFISDQGSDEIVWLIDADNLSFAEAITPEAVFTEEFAAPEVVSPNCVFSLYSDCYSFAISLFQDIYCNHPFKGALCEPGDDDDFVDDLNTKAYSGLLPWIFDEDDPSNESNNGFTIAKDMIASQELLALFEKTFSETGRKKPLSRPTTCQWYYALSDFLDHLVTCKHCSMHFDARIETCPWCDTQAHYITVRATRDGKEIYSLSKDFALDKEFNVPKRLISGPRPSNSDETLFTLTCLKESYVISNLDLGKDSLSLITHDGSRKELIYGSQEIPSYDSKIALSTDSGSDIIIEVSIHGQ